MADDDEPRLLRGVARGFRKRTLVTAKLASKMGMGFVKRTISGGGEQGTGAEAESDQPALDAAAQMVEEIGALKGLVMKIGQIASYMPGALPPKAQRVLTQLQAHTTGLEYAQVEQAVREQLGDAPDALFEEFEREPFAAASIGQVHRARFRGQPVAVKVQYPGIEDALRSDLRTASVLGRLGSVGTAVDGPGLIAELRDRVLEECDYRTEAENQRNFARLWSAMDGALVPAVVGERSAQRVLTTDFDPGQGFYEFCETADQATRNRAGEIIFRVCFDSLFRHSVYNADPHPGNYLFAPDGRVTFIDFGCIRRFEPRMIEAWKNVARSVLANDRPAFVHHFPALGMVANPRKFDWDHQWAMMQYLYRPFLATKPFRYTHEYVQESYGLILFDNPNRRTSAMPGEWLFLNRLQWGLNSVLAHLGAVAPWGEIWRAGVEAETVEPAF